jgi:hypothetical protein
MEHPVAIERRELDAAALAAAHPPRFKHPHKQKIHERVCRSPPSGRIHYSRWAAAPLPERLPARRPELAAIPGVFDYAGSDVATWHLNFADPQLFVAYGSSLLAQDELQALEHPALGSLREALLAEGWKAVTEEGGEPTPVLVSGVERRCALDTTPDLERPHGLYGNRFAAAPFQAVESALRVLEPPTRSNLIAIAAPVGNGRYRLDQIERILVTAYTGFAAAVEESRRLWRGAPVEVRSGFWGCGAFGGNRVLMVLLQCLAARLALVDRLVLYTFDQAGLYDVEQGTAALDALDRAAPPDERVAALVVRIAARGFAWGMSDGN